MSDEKECYVKAGPFGCSVMVVFILIPALIFWGLVLAKLFKFAL